MTTLHLVQYPRPGADWHDLTINTNARGRSAKILVVPGEDVLCRWVQAPGRTPQQKRATGLIALQDELAQSPDQCIVSTSPGPNDTNLFCIADKTVVTNWLHNAQTQGFLPGTIIPDTCLIPVPLETDTTIVEEGTARLIRAHDAAFACQEDLLDTFLGDASRQQLTFVEAAARTLQSTPLKNLPNLIPPQSAHNHHSASTPKSKVLPYALTAAAALAIAAPWVQAVRFDMAARDMQERAEIIARDSLPPQTPIRNARAQLHEALLPVKQGETSLAIISALLADLTDTSGIQLTKLDADTDAIVRANVHVTAIDRLPPLRERLNARGYSVEDIAGDPENGLIPVDLTIRAGAL